MSERDHVALSVRPDVPVAILCHADLEQPGTRPARDGQRFDCESDANARELVLAAECVAAASLAVLGDVVDLYDGRATVR